MIQYTKINPTVPVLDQQELQAVTSTKTNHINILRQGSNPENVYKYEKFRISVVSHSHLYSSHGKAYRKESTASNRCSKRAQLNDIHKNINHGQGNAFCKARMHCKAKKRNGLCESHVHLQANKSLALSTFLPLHRKKKKKQRLWFCDKGQDLLEISNMVP